MSGPEDNLVAVKTFSIRPQADRAKQVLAVAGIESMIQGDDAGGALPPLGYATGGISLLVEESKAEEAKKLLEGIDAD